MNNIKLCIFDMGGVLVRNFNVLPKLKEYFESKNLSLDEHTDCWKNLLSLHGRGLIEEKEVWDRFSKEVGIDFTNENESLLGKFFTPTIDVPTLKVLDTLKASGMRVVCGTNVLDSHYRIHHELNQYDIFDKVYASHLIHIHKPDTDFFTTICKEENVETANTFFTDDFEENVIAAKTVGLHAFLYTDASVLQKQLIDLGAL